MSGLSFNFGLKDTITVQLHVAKRRCPLYKAFNLCRLAGQYGIKGIITFEGGGLFMLLEGDEKYIYECLFDLNFLQHKKRRSDIKFKELRLPYHSVFLKLNARNLKGFETLALKLLFKPYKFKGVEPTDLFLCRFN